MEMREFFMEEPISKVLALQKKQKMQISNIKVSDIPSYGKPPGSMKALMRHATSPLLWGGFMFFVFPIFTVGSFTSRVRSNVIPR